MPLTEAAILAITKSVFSYLMTRTQLDERIRDRLGLDPAQKAFGRAVGKAVCHLEKQSPEWTSSLFDASFFHNEAAPLLAQFLIRNGSPDPSDLAVIWADSLNLQSGERRTTYVNQLEPVAADFLDVLGNELQREPDLQDINDSRAFERTAIAVEKLLEDIEAERSTPGTRRDYLSWLVQRNLYVDARGTFQTQRQVQLRLDDVYVSLSARMEQSPGSVDRSLIVDDDQASLPDENEEAISQKTGQSQALSISEVIASDPRALFARDSRAELAEVVSEHDRLVILGDPGSGKSTLLRFLALTHAQDLLNQTPETNEKQNPPRFPILIRIAEYVESSDWRSTPLSDFLARACRMHECPTNGLPNLFEKELAQGNCLVLLDGLDEVVSDDDRRRVTERIIAFVDRHGQGSNRFVVTSRIAGYASAPLSGTYVHYTIDDMSDEQIHRFLNQWCRAVEDAETPELSNDERNANSQREVQGILQAIHSSNGVHRLATNPLLLRILALIHRTGAQLPRRRIELYKLAAETLARTWRTAQGIPESVLVDDRHLTRLLGAVAYWIHESKPAGIATEREVHAILGAEWARITSKVAGWDPDDPDLGIEEDIGQFLSAVRIHTGLFVLRAPKRYGFMHLTFEEYFAARQLVARPKTRAELIRRHIHDPRWREPILLALGFVGMDYADDAAELLETAILAQGEEAEWLGLTPSPYEEFLGRDYLFALRCLADDIPADPRLVRELTHRAVNEFACFTGLGQFRYHRALLSDLFHELRETDVMQALVKTLVAHLDSDSALLRVSALNAIVGLDEPPGEVINAIRNALDGEDFEIRVAAASLLMTTGNLPEEVLSSLVSRLDDSEPIMRALCSFALWRQPEISEQARARVFRVALYDPDHIARSLAGGKLVEWGYLPQIMEGLKDRDAEVRSAAASAMRWFRSELPVTAVEALVAALQDSDSEVRRASVTALGGRSDLPANAVEALVAKLSDPNAEVRSAAASAMRWFRSELPITAVEALVAALQDSDSEVRSTAAKSLGEQLRLPDSAVSALVAVAVNDPNSEVQVNGALALGRRDDIPREVIERLATLLRTPGNLSAEQLSDGVVLVSENLSDGEEILSLVLTTLEFAPRFTERRLSTCLVDISKRFPELRPRIQEYFVETLSEVPMEGGFQREVTVPQEVAYRGLGLLMSVEV